MEPLLDWGIKGCSWDLGHMMKLATMPIYGKTFENLLKNRMASDSETWHAPFGTRALPNQFCSNGDPSLTLTYLWQGQTWSLRLLYGVKDNTVFM